MLNIELKVLNKDFYKVEKMGGAYYDTPKYATAGSAGIDLVCTEDIIVFPGCTRVIRTGLALYTRDSSVVGMIVPRSGLGSKGLVLANTIGVIDSDYQGEILVHVWNRNESEIIPGYDGGYGANCIELNAGDRFAQMLFVSVLRAKFDEVEEFSTTTGRGHNGFGSTGLC